MRQPGETTEPRASPRLHRACSRSAVDFRAPCLCGARAAPLDAAQDPAGQCRGRTADSRHRRAGPAVWSLRLSQDASGRLAGQRQAGRADLATRGAEGPARQLKRARLWLSNGSCIRLRAECPNHVWSYDFVEERTHDGRKMRMLNIIDEFPHECLAIRVSRRLKSIDVIDVLSDLFILRGVPGHIRSDNGPEFVAKAVQEWIGAGGAETAC